MLIKLIASSDIVVENYLTGSLKKYGLDYETLKNTLPNGKSLIYTSITGIISTFNIGYGQTGPYAKRSGYDVMVSVGLPHCI